MGANVENYLAEFCICRNSFLVNILFAELYNISKIVKRKITVFHICQCYRTPYFHNFSPYICIFSSLFILNFTNIKGSVFRFTKMRSKYPWYGNTKFYNIDARYNVRACVWLLFFNSTYIVLVIKSEHTQKYSDQKNSDSPLVLCVYFGPNTINLIWQLFTLKFEVAFN